MGEPIEPPPFDPDCCQADYEYFAVGTNFYNWPPDECGPSEEQWAWLMYYRDRIFSLTSSGWPGCLAFCIYKITHITDCINDGFTVGMHYWCKYLGMSDNPNESFGANEVMIEQNFGNFEGLLNEQVRVGNDEWFGVRDGTRNVKILFKRDLTVPPP